MVHCKILFGVKTSLENNETKKKFFVLSLCTNRMEFQTGRISPSIRVVRNTTIILHHDENEEHSLAVEASRKTVPEGKARHY